MRSCGVGRHHTSDADRAVPASVQDSAMEEQSAQPHHRRRLRHQGQDGDRRDDRRRRDGALRVVVVDTDQTALDHASGRRPGHRARRCHQIRRTAVGRRSACVVDRRRHQPRRHCGAGHPHRPGSSRRTPRSSRRFARPKTSTCCSNPAPNSVVVSSETAGRLLGIATTTPSVVEMIDDLLTPDAGIRDRRARSRADRGGRFAAAPARHRARCGARR